MMTKIWPAAGRRPADRRNREKTETRQARFTSSHLAFS
jgi:hypothetical protein